MIFFFFKLQGRGSLKSSKNILVLGGASESSASLSLQSRLSAFSLGAVDPSSFPQLRIFLYDAQVPLGEPGSISACSLEHLSGPTQVSDGFIQHLYHIAASQVFLIIYDLFVIL